MIEILVPVWNMFLLTTPIATTSTSLESRILSAPLLNDGTSINGQLSGRDWAYSIVYDGPNYYL